MRCLDRTFIVADTARSLEGYKRIIRKVVQILQCKTVQLTVQNGSTLEMPMGIERFSFSRCISNLRFS